MLQFIKAKPYEAFFMLIGALFACIFCGFIAHLMVENAIGPLWLDYIAFWICCLITPALLACAADEDENISAKQVFWHGNIFALLATTAGTIGYFGLEWASLSPLT